MGNRNGAFGGSGGGNLWTEWGFFGGWGYLGTVLGSSGRFGDRTGDFGGLGGNLGTEMGLLGILGGTWGVLGGIWGRGWGFRGVLGLFGGPGGIWGQKWCFWGSWGPFGDILGLGGGRFGDILGLVGYFGARTGCWGGGLRGIWGSEDSVNANFEVLEVFRGRFGAISGDFGAVPGSGRAPPAAISHRWRRSVLPPPLYGRPSPPKRRPRPPPRPLYPPRLYGSSPSVAWRGKGEGCVTSGGALRFRCVSLVPAGGRRR